MEISKFKFVIRFFVNFTRNSKLNMHPIAQ